MKYTTVLVLSLLCASGVSAKNYKGGELYSKTLAKYGKWEMRILAAKGSGVLSTFFLYKSDSWIEGIPWEEVDIEIFGKSNAKIWQSNIITGTTSQQMSEREHHTTLSMADVYHTFAVEWTPDYVAWFVDGKEIRRSEGGQVAQLVNPSTCRFNLWASSVVSWVGAFNNSILPVHQYINWIRYYAYTPDSASQFTLAWVDDFDSFDHARWDKADWTFDNNLVDFVPENVHVQDGYLVLSLTKAGETGFSGAVMPDTATGVEELQAATWLAYPNPSSHRFTVELEEPSVVRVFDLNGSLVFAQEQASGVVQFGSDFSTGVYLLQVINSNTAYNRKLVKQQ